MSESTSPSTSIQVMARMFSLLDTLAHQGDSVSLKTVSERTGLHPSTAHRILNDLAVGGFVERSGPGTYRLGLRLLQLGNLVKSRLDVRDLAMRPMQELHRLTGQTVALHIRQDDESVCVERTSNERNGVQVNRVMGARTSLVACATGKVLISQWTAAQLHPLTQANGTRADTLHTELQSVRANGLAVDGDSVEAPQQQAAAPILDDQGHIVASLALNTSSLRLSAEWGEALKSAASRISTSLGWSGR
ncbi:IclR family transcriptional regulator [Aquabacterium sp.]|uniref:IclR family transcriptional regulator n=1 Tax=Aquabacterium sp. TaxID=1872578 RepID=UPI002489E2C0|nr:IclR family transcriptional regulator [Aquabacterium sp.]MDI1258155.1 IclR family transcriptional regulator [Aquabacterium sp.]